MDLTLGACSSLERFDIEKGWDRRTREKPAVPCRVIAILAGKGGFAGQRDATKTTLATPAKTENAIAVLT
jgi:hypothetical protein